MLATDKRGSLKPAHVIGLLAGKGDLPHQIITHCQHHKKPLLLLAFEGQTDPNLAASYHPHQWVRLGAVADILMHLKKHHVTHIVMAGAMHRPSWSELKLDWTGTQWLAKMGLKKAVGDDGLLSSAIQLLKAEGFDVLSAHDILADLLAPAGVMGSHNPNEDDWEDILKGREVAHVLGSCDVGQAVVIQQGLVLGVEAIEGTEALLARCGQLRRKGQGGVLVKMAKPNQSREVDLPTIGLDTVQQVQAAGLCGIAIEAGAVQVLDLKAVVKAADKAGLYLVGISPL